MRSFKSFLAESAAEDGLERAAAAIASGEPETVVVRELFSAIDRGFRGLKSPERTAVSCADALKAVASSERLGKRVVHRLLELVENADQDEGSHLMGAVLAFAKSGTIELRDVAIAVGMIAAKVTHDPALGQRLTKSVAKGGSRAAEEYFEATSDLKTSETVGKIVDAFKERAGSPLRESVSKARQKELDEALIDAAEHEDFEGLVEALSNGADPNTVDGFGNFPLHMTAGWDDRAAGTKALLRSGANSNARDADEETPLHWAARFNRADCARALLRAGADLEAKNDAGKTPLWTAVANSSASCVELFLAKKADPNVKEPSGQTPLHVAVSNGDSWTVAALLKAGADQFFVDEEGNRPSDLAKNEYIQKTLRDAIRSKMSATELPREADSKDVCRG